jgi:hypothetical protein
MTDTLKHIEAMQKAAYDMEHQLRRAGYYTRDTDLLDAAVKRGVSGFVVIFDSEGDPAIHAIGPQSANVKIEKGNSPRDWMCAYEPTTVAEAGRIAASGKASAKEIPLPLTAKGLVRDAARMAPLQAPANPALRAKQVNDAAKAKADRQEGIERTQRFAAAVKAASDKQWNRNA